MFNMDAAVYGFLVCEWWDAGGRAGGWWQGVRGGRGGGGRV